MGNGRSGGWPETPIELTAEEREKLQRMARRRNAPHREVIRAQALLRAAAGERNADIGRALGVSRRTLFTWRKEFVARRLEALRERARAGGPRRFSPSGAGGGGAPGLSEAWHSDPVAG